MSKLKKLLASLLAVAMLASVGTGVMAEDTQGTTNKTQEYFELLDNPLSRINSDGSFTFQFSNGLDSDIFHVNSSSVTVEISGTSTQANELFYISIKPAFSNPLMGTSVKADGKVKTVTFSNLKPNTNYQLFFRNDPIDAGTTTVTGSGRISNITVQ